MLSDGRWHEIEEIRQKMQLEENQTQELLTFLKEYNFIVFEETKKAIKIEGAARRFLTHSVSS